MRIFITGASGYVGSVVTEKAIKAGHEVLGLVRSDKSAEKVQKLGATPIHGDLKDIKVLARAAQEVDAILHLGFVHEFDKPYDQLIAIDVSAFTAMGVAIAGSNIPLIHTSGTANVDSDNGKETDENFRIRDGMFRLRADSEQVVVKLADNGIRTASIRLSPYVYGRGGSYFVPMNIEAAAKNGFAAYVGDGSAMTSAADVDAAADMYLLAIENAKPGSIYNCTTETNVTIKQLAEAIGTALGVPTKSVTFEEANKFVGPFAAQFLQLENRASSAKAKRELGWNPQPKYTVCEDILKGSYQPMIQQLKKTAAAV